MNAYKSSSPLLWFLTGKQCCNRTSAHVCSSSLQNLAVPQMFYSTVSISVERTWWARIRWCGTIEFQEHGQMPLYWTSCSLPFCLLYCFPFSSFILWVGIVGLGSSDWLGVNHCLPALHCQAFVIIIIVIRVFTIIIIIIWIFDTQFIFRCKTRGI